MSRHCRDLTEFEPDEHRKCVMHKARATLLEPAAEQINPTAFPSVYWSLRLEAANAYRDIMLIKELAKRPFPKVCRECAVLTVALAALQLARGCTHEQQLLEWSPESPW